MTKNSVHCHNQNKLMCWLVLPNMCALEAFLDENNMFVLLRAINTRFELDREQSPVVTPQGNYHKKISQLLEGYKRKDPSPKFQLAVPLTVPGFMHTFSRSGTKKQKAVGDMALIAFYYLLRVGEYT
jgi:hypothetical protein